MKKKFESIKDLKFQALEKNQMMKILGGDCATGGGDRTMGNGDTLKFSSDVSNSDVMGTKKGEVSQWYYGSGDAASVEDLETCGEC